MATESTNDTREYSKVVLTLENVLIPNENLSQTPSQIDGLDSETEIDLRILGCELVQTSGILLKLPQVAMATGQVLFQRFYYSKSFVKHNMEVVAMACITLASKIEEAPRRIRDVISVFHHIKQVRGGKTLTPLVLDTNYINLKNQVIKSERRVLKELGFCCHVKHPHKLIVTFLQVLDANQNSRLLQCAWNYMNDSFRTDVFVRYDPETIACACIYLAARQLQIPLPNNPAWYELFRVEEEDLKDISTCVLRLYTRAKPNADKLDEIVNEVKKKHTEAKVKAKGVAASANCTPNMASHPGSPMTKVQTPPSSQLTDAVKKIRSEDERSDGSGGAKRRRVSPDHGRYNRSNSRSTSRSPVRNNKPRAYRSPSSGSASPATASKPARHSSPNERLRRNPDHHRSSSKRHKDSRERDRGREKSHKQRHHSPANDVSRERNDKHAPAALRNLPQQQRSHSSASLTTSSGKRDRSRSRSVERSKKRSNGHHDRENYRR